MRYFYSALFIVLLPLILLRMIIRSRRAPAYRQRLAERLGYFNGPNSSSAVLTADLDAGVESGSGRETEVPALPAQGAHCIWVHAVSLGETLAARPLIEKLLESYPDHTVVVTTTTPTGSQQVQQLFQERVFHVYAPWDTPGAVKRFLARVKPRLLILMETELWPNMLHYSCASGCRILLANARLSAKSAGGYARFPKTTRDMFATLDWVAVQNAQDADRFMQLGMAPDRMSVSGSIKFDLRLDDALRSIADTLRQDWKSGDRPTLIAASTHRGEDGIVLEAFSVLRETYPNALLLLAPRHPERFGEVADLCDLSEWQTERRSQTDGLQESTDILLLDTLGELLMLYGVADVALIGGSFIDRGGHNPLEAAVWGIPILAGPSMTNFHDVAAKLSLGDALKQLPDAAALSPELEALFADREERQRRGKAALAVVEENRGALSALEEAVRRLLGPH